MQIAVIGAGLAGLAAAAGLRSSSAAVTVFEKSRGVGGRTSTRRAGELRFDHGAPLVHDSARPLTAHPALAAVMLTELGGGLREERVALPTANALAKALAEGVDTRTGIRVATIIEAGGSWELRADDGTQLGDYDAVVVTAPAPQAAELLRAASPRLAARAASVPFAACWSVMAAWDAPLELGWTLARGRAGLSVAIAESAKPGRAAGERWVLQADPELTEAELEATPEAVGALLLARLGQLAGRPLPAPQHIAAHRWRFARPLAPLAEPCLVDGTLVVAGDWCGGSTAGAALRSGQAAAAALAAVAV